MPLANNVWLPASLQVCSSLAIGSWWCHTSACQLAKLQHVMPSC